MCARGAVEIQYERYVILFLCDCKGRKKFWFTIPKSSGMKTTGNVLSLQAKIMSFPMLTDTREIPAQ